ncbi:MAG: hypothetical protein K2N31_10570 [Treponemataceae bacterium]|nr:hypothetical protein [Treponemataceae bacterium]
MEIKGKVHCFFEQSGTFKNEFRKLGYEAFDYDIQDEFGEMDYVTDLFREIDSGFAGQKSLFDEISVNDLIIAFFPCIYFETMSQLDFSLVRNGTQDKPLARRIEYALERLRKRTVFHGLLYKLVAVCDERKLRLIIENPAKAPNYLITGHNFPPPTLIDKNRMERGDWFMKPTAKKRQGKADVLPFIPGNVMTIMLPLTKPGGRIRPPNEPIPSRRTLRMTGKIKRAACRKREISQAALFKPLFRAKRRGRISRHSLL